MEAATSPAEWRAEFHKQANASTMEAAIHYARSLASRVEARTGRPDPVTAEDRVHAAILGTLDGRFRWHPERCELAPHLKWAVKRAVTDELRRATRYTHVSIEHDCDATEREVSDALAVDRDPRAEAVQSCFAIWATHMRSLAEADQLVLRLLAAYDEGAVERHEVIAATGMSSRTYHTALQRLKRLAKKLPDEFHDAAVAAIAGGDAP